MDQFDRHGDTEYVDFEDSKDGFWTGEGRSADLAMSESASMRQEVMRWGATGPDDARKGDAKMKSSEMDALDEDDEDRLELCAGEEDEEDDDEAEDDLPAVSRKVRRRRKRSRPRSKTIAMKRLTREELRIGALLYPPVDVPRPSTRSECMTDFRPCPWVACKHHLYLDVNPETGSIKINFPDLEPWELPYTCALDVADRGGITLEEVGEIMNLTRERIRQVEVRGLRKLRAASPSPEELGAELPLDE
jgi:hypothetical protein